VPDAFIASVFAVMAATPQHTYQVLTKRPRRMRALLASDAFCSQVDADGLGLELVNSLDPLPWPAPNVWLGTSIENDDYTWRADCLRQVPAAVRFLSCEPLIGPLDGLDVAGIDWLIIGGESGSGARRTAVRWVRDLLSKCQQPGVSTAPFVKQLGVVTGRELGAGPKGGDWDAWPPDLRVREFPRPAAASLPGARP
jgi:protein gp37